MRPARFTIRTATRRLRSSGGEGLPGLLVTLLGAIAAAVLGPEHVRHLTALADRLAGTSAQIRIRLTVLLVAGIAPGTASLGFEATLGTLMASVLARMLDPSPN